jgi:translocation and assembly module TamB
MRLRRILGWTLGLALLIPVALLVTGYGLLATETGSRWLIERAVAGVGATTVAISRVRGRLIDHIELNDAAIDVAGTRVVVEQMDFTWSPRALLDGSLLIEQLRLDGVDVTLPPSSPDSARAPPAAIPALPFAGVVRDFTVLRLVVHNPDQDVLIDQLSLAATWDRDAIVLENVRVSATDHQLTADMTLGIGDAARHELNASWHGAIGDAAASASMTAAGPIDKLAVTLNLDGPVVAEIAGDVQPLAEPVGMSLHGRVQAPQLGGDVTLGDIDFDINGDLATLTLDLSTQAGLAGTGDYALTAAARFGLEATTEATKTVDIDWRADPLTAKLPAVAGHGRIFLDGDRIALTHATDAPLATSLSGTVGLGGAAPALDLKLAWQDFVLPLGSPNDIIGRSGTITAIGSPDALAIVVTGSFAGTPVGPVDVDVRARLGGHSLNVENLNARLLKGNIDTRGTLDWSGDPSAEFRFSGRELDFSRFQAESPSRVAFAGQGTFTASADGPRATLELENVGGELRGHEISGAASMHTSPQAIVVDSARFAAGENRIAFRGTWSDALSGDFDLALKDLGAFDPRLSGSVTGQGAIGGELLHPRIDAEIAGQGLKFDRFTATNLGANIDIDLTRTADSTATFNFTGLKLDGDAIGDVTLRGSGTAAEHSLRLSFDGPNASFESAAAGHFIGDKWVGEMAELDARSSVTGAWSLTAPSALSVSGDDAAIADTCLESGAARVCITASRLPSGGKARIAITGLPLGLADFYLPQTIHVRGSLNGAVEIAHDGTALTGSGSLAVADGIVQRETVGAAMEEVAIESLSANFTLAPDTFAADVRANIERWLDVDGSVTTGRTSDAPLSGTLSAHANDLAWLADFAPKFAGTNGELELKVDIDGSRSAPKGRGELSLASGALTAPDIGLVIERFDATFDASPEAIVFNAACGAGTGELKAQGKASKSADTTHWQYTVDLGGQDFPLVRMPEAEADVSPDLKLTGDEQGLHIGGTLTLPRVVIDVARLPSSSINVSEDEIIITNDDSDPDEMAKRGFMTESVSGAVGIRLGDKVSVNGFGLTSNLSGGIDWKKRRGEPLGKATGKINLDNGFFRAYGQHLEIENGRIVFAGPIDNPNLNLRAFRPDLPVKAGVNVRGSAREPKISLFSEPPQSDGDTLSYIITGRALDDASADESAVLAKAALSLGADESAAVMNQISATFGLDELSLNTGSTVEDTSLVAGKRLSRKLSVRTDYNPFEQLWTFFLNYELTPHWSVEAESGERQGADLLYSVEGEDLLEALSPFD